MNSPTVNPTVRLDSGGVAYYVAKIIDVAIALWLRVIDYSGMKEDRSQIV